MNTDYLIINGTVYDGTGSEPQLADLAISGDTVTEIGPDLASKYRAGRTIDAAGLAVAPGFIDIHTHSDLSVLINPKMESSVQQGVTTELVGNCGMSIALIGQGENFTLERRWSERAGIVVDWGNFDQFFTRLGSLGAAINIGSLAGHGTIRKGVMAFEKRAPNEAEKSAMREILSKAMENGAFGLSTGLEYLPGGYAELDEICTLAEVARDAGGFYASHIRNEGDTLVESIAEGLAVGERTGIPVQLSHHKSEGRKNWGKVKTTLSMMQKARESGLDVLTDQYPYTAYMTGLTVILLPDWANSGSGEETIARLADPEVRARIAAEVNADPPDWNNIVIGVARNRRDLQGLSLAQIAKNEGKSPVDAALDLIIGEEGWIGAAHFAMSEEDVEYVMRDPYTMIGSDAVASSPHGLMAQDRSHPRSYGTFARVLGLYVRERGVLSLSEAIRRMTSLPAQRLRLTDRGKLAARMKADIAIFNPEAVEDLATFEQPHQFARGVEYVFVNGRLAVEGGQQTEARAGQILRRS
jgi:N-acyl-D-amino-acid deacylase